MDVRWTQFDQIADEITAFTGLPAEEVRLRLRNQMTGKGNVPSDLARFGVTPHHYDEAMERLYRESYGFIFETLAFQAEPARRSWTVRALERMRRHAEKCGVKNGELKVLMLGDGTGGDSMALCAAGFNVDYFDIPGSKTFAFAIERFRHYGLIDNGVRIVHNYAECLTGDYDVVMSFELLEHLTDPLRSIKEIGIMLKRGGLALITEAFGVIGENNPTHLSCNYRFRRLTPYLFLKAGMVLTWYNRECLCKPMEFTKISGYRVAKYFPLMCCSVIENTAYPYVAFFKKPQVLKRLSGKIASIIVRR